jgi:hypothetical protein
MERRHPVIAWPDLDDNQTAVCNRLSASYLQQRGRMQAAQSPGRGESPARHIPLLSGGALARRLAWLVMSLWISLHATAANADSVVLIVSASSPIQQLRSGDLRKLFMGFDVVLDNVELRAVRNRSDARLDAIFLQNIVDLSELVYERQLLARKLQNAASLPAEYRSEQLLLDAVARDPRAVSFAWSTSTLTRSDIRVLRILWHD